MFTSPGFGTIVTGTTQCGELAVGDDVVFHPGGATTRVRGLEVHGERADEVGPGVRAAVNAPDLDLASTARSGLLVHADGPVPTSMIDATFIPIARLPEPIADGEKGLVHLGTARVEATLALLDPIPAAGAPPPAAGAPRAAQLRLAEPLAFVPGAAYVFRGFRTWPGRPDLGLTLGGGRALAPSARRQRTGPTSSDQVRALAGPPEAGLLAWVEAHGEAGAARASLAGSLPWPRATIDRVVADAVTAGTAHVTVTTVVARAALVHLERAVLRALDDYHRERPTRPGLRLDELRTRARPSAAPDLFEQVVARLVAAGQLAQVGDALAAAGFAATAAADDALQAAIVERLDEADLSPPKLAELGPSLPGSPSAALLAEAAVALVAAGRLVRAGPDLLFAASALARFEARVRAHFATAEWMDAQALKELAGASRKFAIPLGEWLDKARVTVRVGDRRRLRG
ncbi:MAG: SelB C-terminal domain-containing protein [Myxococcota bacterium]